MPSTYAHFRFGQEVYKELLPKCRTVIDAFRPLYDIGLHGPDILFYYHALQPNAVSAVGFEAHERPGRDFFSAPREFCGRAARRSWPTSTACCATLRWM